MLNVVHVLAEQILSLSIAKTLRHKIIIPAPQGQYILYNRRIYDTVFQNLFLEVRTSNSQMWNITNIKNDLYTNDAFPFP